MRTQYSILDCTILCNLQMSGSGATANSDISACKYSCTFRTISFYYQILTVGCSEEIDCSIRTGISGKPPARCSPYCPIIDIEGMSSGIIDDQSFRWCSGANRSFL